MPTLIAATVIVMISKGILKIPNNPSTIDAVMRFGINPIKKILNERKIIKNKIPIIINTKPKDLICEENKDCNILLYKTARPVISN